MLKIGLVGTGHLGKIHLRNLLELPVDFEVVGFYDTDDPTVQEIQREFQTTSFSDLEDLMNASEALLIASPTLSHFPIAVQALKKANIFSLKNRFVSRLKNPRNCCFMHKKQVWLCRLDTWNVSIQH